MRLSKKISFLIYYKRQPIILCNCLYNSYTYHYLGTIVSMEVLVLAVVALVTILLFLGWNAFCVFRLSPEGVRRRLAANGFDGPPPEFPWGNLSAMFRERRKAVASIINHDIHSIVFPFFATWRKAFGKVFIYWQGTEPFLYIADPEFLKLVTSGALGNKWGKPNVFKHDRRPMFGNGLVMVEGEDWSHHRHIIAPAFSMTNLEAMMGLMVESTTNMIDEWSMQLSSKNQTTVDVEEYITKNAAEIIAKASFGLGQEKGKQVFQKLQLMQSMLFKTNRLVGVPFSKMLCPKQSYDAWKLGKEIDELLLSIINSRKEEVSNNTGAVQQDLLSLLLAGNQENALLERKLTTRELVDECKTFFFGGHETTALALTWTLFLLALYPEWQKILRDEIAEVSGGHTLTSTMLNGLTKMGWVWNEVLRLYSPAPNVQRQAREDIHVGDIQIPKGTNMWIDVVGMHHDEELWGKDVNEFKPERFRDGGMYGGCKHRMGYLPFGFGGRICVGRNLTMMEYKIVLSLILRKFSLSVSPLYTHSPKIMLSLRPSFGVPLLLQPLGEEAS